MKSLVPFCLTALLLCPSVIQARDERLVGVWNRTATTDPGARWTLKADGTGEFVVEFGPQFPDFLLITRFSNWTTNSSNTAFTYTVDYQGTNQSGPYEYTEPVSPAKTYTEPYTLGGTGANLWGIGTYSYQKGTGEAGTVYDDFEKNDSYEMSNLAGSGISGDSEGVKNLAEFGFGSYGGVTLDLNSNSIVSDGSNHVIRKVSPEGVVTTLAGTGTQGYVDGPGNVARFNNPRGIDSDSAGNIYVADTGNHSIRKISPEGLVTTLAGSATPGSSNGTGSGARFYGPRDVAVDLEGNVWVADTINNLVRRIAPNGAVTSWGTGQPASIDGTPEPLFGSNKPWIRPAFLTPRAIECDERGRVFIAEPNKIRLLGLIIGNPGVTGASNSTVTGANTSGITDAGLTTARFGDIQDLAWDSVSQSLFVTENASNRIRRVYGASGSSVVTIAGSLSPGKKNGTGTHARFNKPTGLAFDPYGNFRVVDTGNYRIRQGTSIPPQDQNIDFPPLADRSGSAAPFNLSATASSGLPVTFALVSGPANLVGNQVALTGDAGLVVVLATQDGKSRLQNTPARSRSAPPVTRSFKVTAGSTAPPLITLQPISATVREGQSATLTVAASGSNLTYQWYKGSSGSESEPVTEARESSFKTPPLDHFVRYWVKVSNSLGSKNSQSVEINVNPKSDGAAVFAGNRNGFFLQKSGAAWGAGYSTAMGLPQSTSMTTWNFQLMTGVSSIVPHTQSTAFLRTDNTVWGLGSGYDGIFGTIFDSDGFFETPVQLGTGVKAIAKDMRLNMNGSVTFGYANPGPGVQPYMTGVRSIAAGKSHSMYLKENGSLWASGFNDKGQCGVAQTSFVSTPTQIATDVVKVSAGSSHTLFVKSDGSAWATGSNSRGELGDGSNTNQNIPIQIMYDVADVSAGEFHSFFLKTDGSLWATGSNGSGALGDGTSVSRSSPVKITTDVASVSAGNQFSLILKKDGTFWSMGDESDGRLGYNTLTTNSKSIPTQVILGPEIISEQPPSDIRIFAKSASSGINSPLHLLAAIDPDSVIFHYALVGGAGSGDNLKFNIVDGQLRANNAALLQPGVYAVRIGVTDESGNSFSKALAVTVGEDHLLDKNVINFAVLKDQFHPGPSFDLSATSTSGLPVTYSVVWGPAVLSGKKVTLTGLGQVVIRASQAGNGTFARATPKDRSFKITLGNLPPVAKALQVKTAKNKSVAVKLSGTDPEKNALKYSIVKAPKKGKLTGKAPKLTYKPKSNFTGTDKFTYRVNDGKLDSAVVTVTIAIGSTAKSALRPTQTIAEATPAPDPFIDFLANAEVPAGHRGQLDDPDQDGIPNLLEYLFGGNPVVFDRNLLPTITKLPESSNLVFSYQRKIAILGVSQVVEFSDNLISPWTPVVHGENGVTISTVAIPGDATSEQIVVTIPATSSSRFVRLNASR